MGAGRLLRPAVCLGLSRSEHSQGPQHLRQSTVGAAQHSDTDQCTPRSPYRKGTRGTSLSGQGHQDLASHSNTAPPHHYLAPGWTPQFQPREKGLDFEISPTWVQVLAPPFQTVWLRAGYLPSLSISLIIYKVGVRILTSEVIMKHKWDKVDL